MFKSRITRYILCLALLLTMASGLIGVQASYAQTPQLISEKTEEPKESKPSSKSLKLLHSKYQPKEGQEYRFPSLDLLDEPSQIKSSVSDEELNNTAHALRETLATFDVGIEEGFI